MLAGKKIVIAVTGSIAAYKIPILVRQLVKKGGEIKIIMTPAASDFVSRLTLSTLSKNPVLVDLFEEGTWANHVMLGRWADLMLMAPLSCNTLSKMAAGLCDNLVMATYLSATCPVLVAPAMDEDMWQHPTTKNNLKQIEQHGCVSLPVGYGELASGLTGEGRMAEPEEIMTYLEDYFSKSASLKGKKALVTAGPTYEAIDPVRFIGNHSSGKMGYAVAEELGRRGADVTLVSGPVHFSSRLTGVNVVSVTSAEEMYQACMQTNGYDIAVMAAAVADYTPSVISDKKIKKKDEGLDLNLKKTKDILASLGKIKTDRQILVGFALETDNEEAHATQKLGEKNADMIVLNSLRDEGAGFGHDTNKATFYFKSGSKKQVALKTKKALAKDIVDSITELL
jgi:phosphopantothenoylcysteine decarboxylase / phosphopantothenate---cysteine ligase